MANSQSPVEQMTDLLSSESDRTQLHVPLSRGAVSSVSLARTDLLSHVEPLPLNQLICHSAATVCSRLAAHREDILAFAYHDMAVARRNMAELTRYLDIQLTGGIWPWMRLIRIRRRQAQTKDYVSYGTRH